MISFYATLRVQSTLHSTAVITKVTWNNSKTNFVATSTDQQ